MDAGYLCLKNHKPFCGVWERFCHNYVFWLFASVHPQGHCAPIIRYWHRRGSQHFSPREMLLAEMTEFAKRYLLIAGEGDLYDAQKTATALQAEFELRAVKGKIAMPSIKSKVYAARYDLGLPIGEAAAFAEIDLPRANKFLRQFSQADWNQYKQVLQERKPYDEVFAGFVTYVDNAPKQSPCIRISKDHRPSVGDLLYSGNPLQWHALIEAPSEIGGLYLCWDKDGTTNLYGPTAFVPKSAIDYLIGKGCVVHTEETQELIKVAAA